MPTVPKDPDEKFEVSFDFDGDLNDTETILLGLCSVSATDKNGDDATSALIKDSSLRLSGTTLYFTINNGSYDLSPYKVVLRARTDENYAYVHDIFVVVTP